MHRYKNIQKKRHKHRRADDSSDSDDDEADEIKRVGSKVYFFSDVSSKSVLQLTLQLDEAATTALACASDPRDAKVMLYLHSNGGCAYSGMAAHDVIRGCRVPVWCIALGYVASAATFMHLAGARRFATTHSTILIHEVSTWFKGKLQELQEEMHNTELLMGMCTNLYLENTKIKPKRLEKMLKKDTTILFDEAIRLGFIEGEVPTSGTKCDKASQSRSHVRFNDDGE